MTPRNACSATCAVSRSRCRTFATGICRQIPVAKVRHRDLETAHVAEQAFRGVMRLALARLVPRQHPPAHGAPWVPLDELANRAATADLQVVGVGADADHARSEEHTSELQS